MKRTAAIIGLLAVAAGACGVKPDGPPRIEVDRTPCAHCGMLISEPMFAAAYRAPEGGARVFDDIGCLVASLSREPGTDGIRFWFHDADDVQWIDGAEAVFVKSDRLRTPMAGGLIAYRGRAPAEDGARKHDARLIYSVSDLLADSKRLRPERGAGSPVIAPGPPSQGYGGQPSPETTAKAGGQSGEAGPPRESERGWGPASTKKRGQP